MSEAILATIGAVSLAGPLWAINAWLERKSKRQYRQEIALSVAKWLMVWRAGDIARLQGKAEARQKGVELV